MGPDVRVLSMGATEKRVDQLSDGRRSKNRPKLVVNEREHRGPTLGSQPYDRISQADHRGVRDHGIEMKVPLVGKVIRRRTDDFGGDPVAFHRVERHGSLHR